MNVLVIGLNHRTAGVGLLERAVAGTTDRDELLAAVLAGPNVREAVVLSSCNRVELYAAVSTFHGGLHEVGGVLAERVGIELPELAESLYVHYAADAVRHLFSVTAGLDSMVVGESQILGQVRQAYTAAADLGAPGRLLHELMQQALRVGKRVHADTGIDRAGQSVVSTALAVGERLTGPVAGKSALVIGAGSMGALAAATLQRAGVGSLTVANRSGIRAAQLAGELAKSEQGTTGGEDTAPDSAATKAAAAAGPTVVRLDQLASVLPAADIIVSATASTHAVLTADALATARANRTGGDQVVLDLAVPRDVEPAVGELPGVHLVDIAALNSWLTDDARPAGDSELTDDSGLTDDSPLADALAEDQVGTSEPAEADAVPALSNVAAEEVTAAEAIVAAEVAAFAAWQRSVDVAPTVTALRSRADEVVTAELTRLAGRLPDLDDRTRSEVERSVRRVVATLLHVPTVRVKELAASPDGYAYATALRELFGLDPAEASAPDAFAIRPSEEPDQLAGEPILSARAALAQPPTTTQPPAGTTDPAPERATDATELSRLDPRLDRQLNRRKANG